MLLHRSVKLGVTAGRLLNDGWPFRHYIIPSSLAPTVWQYETRTSLLWLVVFPRLTSVTPFLATHNGYQATKSLTTTRRSTKVKIYHANLELHKMQEVYEVRKKEAVEKRFSLLSRSESGNVAANPYLHDWRKINPMCQQTFREMQETHSNIKKLTGSLHRCQLECFRCGHTMRSGHSNYLYIVEREFANTLLKLKGNGFIKHNRINICARTVLEELVTLLYREEKEALGNIYGLKQVLLDNRGRKQKLSKSVNIISKWNLTLSDISAQAEMTKMHYNDVNQMNNDARKLMGAAQQCAKGTSTWLARFGSHYTNVEVAANRLESKGIKERNKTLKSMHVIHEAILSCKDRMHVTNGIRKILKNTHTHNAADVTLKSIGTRLHDIEQMKGKHRKTILDINRAIDILNIESEVLLRQVSAVTDTINKNEVALKSLSKKFPIIGVEVDWNHDDMECTAVSQKMLLAIEEENIYSDVCHADGAAKRTKILDDFKSLLATLQEDVAREKGDLENTTINAVADVSVARAIVDSMRLGEMQAKNAAKIALEADRIATRDVWHTLNKQDEIHSSTCIPLHEQLLRAVFGN